LQVKFQNEEQYQSFEKFIDYILNHTKYSIAFIPHVLIDGNDDREILDKLYRQEYKFDKYRIFIIKEPKYRLIMSEKIEDKISQIKENGKTNLSILDKKYEILSISQFTLCAMLDGRRPSFSNAMNAQMAKDFYLKFNQMLKNLNMIVKEGVFQTEMEVELINDGPFTIYIDSNNL